MADEMSLEEWIKYQLQYEYDQIIISEAHMALWGIPCGPTLTMVHPKQVRGILNGDNVWTYAPGYQRLPPPAGDYELVWDDFGVGRVVNRRELNP